MTRDIYDEICWTEEVMNNGEVLHGGACESCTIAFLFDSSFYS